MKGVKTRKKNFKPQPYLSKGKIEQSQKNNRTQQHFSSRLFIFCGDNPDHVLGICRQSHAPAEKHGDIHKRGIVPEQARVLHRHSGFQCFSRHSAVR